MTELEFIRKELPECTGQIDHQIKITPNEICSLMKKFNKEVIKDANKGIPSVIPEERFISKEKLDMLESKGRWEKGLIDRIRAGQ